MNSIAVAEAIAAVSLVSLIIQLVDYSSKTYHPDDFQSSSNDVSKTFRDLKNELPLLVDAFYCRFMIPLYR
jgi:hypothetical protein